MLNSKQMQIENAHKDGNGADILTNMVKRAKLDVCRRLANLTAGRQ
jgi:hypothetical protein